MGDIRELFIFLPVMMVIREYYYVRVHIEVFGVVFMFTTFKKCFPVCIIQSKRGKVLIVESRWRIQVFVVPFFQLFGTISYFQNKIFGSKLSVLSAV